MNNDETLDHDNIVMMAKQQQERQQSQQNQINASVELTTSCIDETSESLNIKGNSDFYSQTYLLIMRN